MKKFTIFILILLLIVGITGCDLFNDILFDVNDKNDTIEEELMQVEKDPDEGFYWD